MQLTDDKLARVGNPVRDAYHRELMAYMTTKAKAPKGMELSSDGFVCVHHTHQVQGSCPLNYRQFDYKQQSSLSL